MKKTLESMQQNTHIFDSRFLACKGGGLANIGQCYRECLYVDYRHQESYIITDGAPDRSISSGNTCPV